MPGVGLLDHIAMLFLVFLRNILFEYSSLILCVLKVLTEFLLFCKPSTLFFLLSIMRLPKTPLNFSVTSCLTQPPAPYNLRISKYLEMKTCIDCWTPFYISFFFLGILAPEVLGCLVKSKLFFSGPISSMGLSAFQQLPSVLNILRMGKCSREYIKVHNIGIPSMDFSFVQDLGNQGLAAPEAF